MEKVPYPCWELNPDCASYQMVICLARSVFNSEEVYIKYGRHSYFIFVLEVVTRAVYFQRTVIAEYIFCRKPHSDNLEELTMCIWEANIKIYLNRIRKGAVGWSHLAQDIQQCSMPAAFTILRLKFTYWIPTSGALSCVRL
jgi:hypothetical protein